MGPVQVSSEKEHRLGISKSVFETGNPWVDDALAGGLNKENFMLVAAKTGTGKTFFGVQLASHAARSGKRVQYYALEAEKYEIERRRIYYTIARLVHQHYPQIKMPRYREWLHMAGDTQWSGLENEAERIIAETESTLDVIYANGVYTPEMFKQETSEIILSDAKPDLIILDHLHHFFLSGDEIESLKTTIHALKKIKDDLEIPLVVLAQLRKTDGGLVKRSLPKIEDIRGTASLTDVATDVLIISKVSDDKVEELPIEIKFPMYFHIAKCRTAAEVTQYAGVVGFDSNTGQYQEKYVLTKVKGFEDPEVLESKSKPTWAIGAVCNHSIPGLVKQKKDWTTAYE